MWVRTVLSLTSSLPAIPRKKDDHGYPKTALKRSAFLSRSGNLSFSPPRYSSIPNLTGKGDV